MNRAIQDRAAAVFNALAHPMRLGILEKLRQGPCCVCKIIPYVGGEQSNVSHHLAILRRANIVDYRKRGIEVWYEVIDTRIFEIIDLVEKSVLSDLRKIRKFYETIAQSTDEG